MGDKRKFVIGDIRGEIGLLKDLFDLIQPSEQDFLLFLGSYLGPGADSKAVLDYLIEFKQTFKGEIIFLWGCYETVFQEIIAENCPLPIRNVWSTMQGSKALASYTREDKIIRTATVDGKIIRSEIDFKIPKTHMEFMQRELHQWYQDHTDNFVASHAGLNPRNFLQPTMEETTFGCTIRGQGWWDSDWRIPDIDIVFSHVPFKAPFMKAGKIGIDLGAGFGGRLCAVEFPSRKFQVVSGIRRSIPVNGGSHV